MSHTAPKKIISSSEILHIIASLRMVVGYLGESDRFSWWPSSFFSSASRAFLAPFTKTQLLAQCAGVTAAAALVHDDRIGVGHVHHLFRLPEASEQALHRALQTPEMIASIRMLIASQNTALAYLESNAPTLQTQPIGPTVVGDSTVIKREAEWATVATLYLHGFRAGVAVYPYFTASTP